MCKPVVKWVGGKRQVLNDLCHFLPETYNNYYEPFIGGGALFFHLKPKKSFISDYNKELINVYKIIRDDLDSLYKDLKSHINTKEYFYEMRVLDRKKDYEKLSSIKKASRFIYLNKTGFNGLYRVNLKGECNTPYGYYKNPKYADLANLKECQKLLINTKIKSGDFEIIKKEIKKGDFVYLDPPYAPLKEDSFVSYTDKKFCDDTQIRLKKLCDYINEKGAYFMLSNSYSKSILKLYSNYNIKTILANRAINCKATGRGKIKEVVVLNYKPKKKDLLNA